MNRDTIVASLADPTRDWIVILVGIVLIYREFMSPGRVLPGMFGAVGVCTGVYFLFQHPWSGIAAGMIAIGIALLILQGFRQLYWIPTFAAAGLITWGAHWLTEPRIGLPPAAAAIPLCGVTGYLWRTAVLARRRKLSVQ